MRQHKPSVTPDGLCGMIIVTDPNGTQATPAQDTLLPTHPSGEPVKGNPYRIRDMHASALTEIWLVSAVVTILLIRIYLELTGYPQVGGDSLHIAHMLWGGLGMVIGFGMLIIFAHPVWKPFAALVGGAGFGAFIDELGKFITKDNDYFYQPTIALIYAIFVVFFLIARYFESKREPTTADHLFHAVEGLQWASIGKLDEHRKEHALSHLDAIEESSGFAGRIREMLESATVAEHAEQSRILESRDRLLAGYWRLVSHHWLERVVIGLFILKGVEVLGSIAVGVATRSFTVDNGLSFSEWGATIAAAAGGLLAFWGVIRLMRRARVAALHAFALSILVSLLFGQFFAFASDQLLAFGNLVVSLLILGVLRIALAAEADLKHHEGDDSSVDPDSGVGQLLV